MEGPHISDDLGNYVTAPGQFDSPHILGDTRRVPEEEPLEAIDMGYPDTIARRHSRSMITGRDHDVERSIFICKGTDAITKRKCGAEKRGAASRCTNMNCSNQLKFSDTRVPIRTKPHKDHINCKKCGAIKKRARSLCPCTPAAIRKPRGTRKSHGPRTTIFKKTRASGKAGMKHKKSKRKRSKKSKRKRR